MTPTERQRQLAMHAVLRDEIAKTQPMQGDYACADNYVIANCHCHNCCPPANHTTRLGRPYIRFDDRLQAKVEKLLSQAEQIGEPFDFAPNCFVCGEKATCSVGTVPIWYCESHKPQQGPTLAPVAGKPVLRSIRAQLKDLLAQIDQALGDSP